MRNVLLGLVNTLIEWIIGNSDYVNLTLLDQLNDLKYYLYKHISN